MVKIGSEHLRAEAGSLVTLKKSKANRAASKFTG
jgi:hypothetical protein